MLVSGDPSETGRDDSVKPWFTSRRMSGELTIGHYHGEPVLYFSLPVSNSKGQYIGTVYATVNLDWMKRALFNPLDGLPEGSQLILLDESQGMLSYDVDTGKWSIPDSLNPALLHKIGSRPSGTLSMPDEKDFMWIYAYAPLLNAFRKGPVSMVLKIPEDVALV